MPPAEVPTISFRLPDVSRARHVFAVLGEQGIVAALGGSGLLAALGLVSVVSDWDITTDAALPIVEHALESAGIVYQTKEVDSGSPYRSTALLVIDSGEIDLIVEFAIRHEDEVVRLPTAITGHWLGIPVGDPRVWAQAYHLLGRSERADLLENWLMRQC